MKLTEQQLRFFNTFGFLFFPGLFAKDINTLTNEFEQTWTEHGGDQHDHTCLSANFHQLYWKIDPTQTNTWFT